RGQPDLDAALRPGTGEDGGRLRPPRHAAHASGAPRLPRRALRRRRLLDQVAAPAAAELPDLSDVEPPGAPERGGGPRRRPPLALPSPSARRGEPEGRAARRERGPRPLDGRRASGRAREG